MVTVKDNDPAGSPVTVVLVPLPEVVTPPGLRVNVHVPDEGSPLSATLPVATVHVGWVIVPTTGADGVTGCVLITAFADEGEVQPSELVTVKVYDPEGTPEMVVLVPLPTISVAPGFRIKVQLPDGNPLSAMLPVDTAHVGWVIDPITGADGAGGCGLITTLDDATEVHPSSFVIA